MRYYDEYVTYVYNLVKKESEGLDAIYKDFILKLVGEHGFNALLTCELIEGCGSINLRELYTLCNMR